MSQKTTCQEERKKIFKSAVPKTLNPHLHLHLKETRFYTQAFLLGFNCLIHIKNNRLVEESLHHKLLDSVSWSPKAHRSLSLPANKPPSCSGQRLHLSGRLQTRWKPWWKVRFRWQSLSCLLELSAERRKTKAGNIFGLISVSPETHRQALLQPDSFQSHKNCSTSWHL